jgi:glucokinase
MEPDAWAIGVDLGGTKVEVAAVDATGKICQRSRRPTRVQAGPEGIRSEIAEMVAALRPQGLQTAPVGVGVGVAGQIEADRGLVRFAPNLHWQDVPFQEDLRQALGLPVVLTNDVRAATWGEWLHGAGQGCDDLICLFVGTGVGGGVVSGGRMLTGCSNTAGELGHITIDLNGPPCRCPNRGCLEALAGGWAIARRAREAITGEPKAGQALLQTASALKGKTAALADVTAEVVARAAQAGDPLARMLVHEVAEALVAGAVSLVNAFNPCRLILGGGVMEGLPELVARIEAGIHRQALEAARSKLRVLPAQLHNDAGVIGAGALALRTCRA